jgi:hypothetical protein
MVPASFQRKVDLKLGLIWIDQSSKYSSRSSIRLSSFGNLILNIDCFKNTVSFSNMNFDI